jgi:hypothetical protein
VWVAVALERPGARGPTRRARAGRCGPEPADGQSQALGAARRGIVSREPPTPDMQVRAESVGVHPHADDAGGVMLRSLAADHDDAARRIHVALGVDPIHLESG